MKANGAAALLVLLILAAVAALIIATAVPAGLGAVIDAMRTTP